ncbi:MAG: prolyl-tRNA synthetase associated domain-containing protein [Rhodospirillaceae bacterium]|nr:prolyl-tRNA synthetase associated domain-containing protein [Rhodospirillaceae bacterium]
MLTPQTATPPFDADGLFARLDTLGLAHETHEHAPVFTVDESQSLRGVLPGAHVKNLFLRDKKKCYWLVTVAEDRNIDLKALRRRLGASGSLSFGAADVLMAHLGVRPGAVTPFGIINDANGMVSMVLDQDLLAGDIVNVHPLRNDMTTAMRPDDLLAFLNAENHAPLILDFNRLEGETPLSPGAKTAI